MGCIWDDLPSETSRLDCLSERIYEANSNRPLSPGRVYAIGTNGWKHTMLWLQWFTPTKIGIEPTTAEQIGYVWICFNFPQSDVVHTIKIITECQVFGKDGPQLQFCFKQLWCWRNPINPCPGAAQVASIIRYPKNPYFLKETPQNHVTLKNLEMIQICK
jgi:hypothetical protein